MTQAATDWPLGQWIDQPVEHLTDPDTGVPYRVLSGGIGNNHHVYFNRPNFSHDGRQVIFLSDRTGKWQIYACDLENQRIRRLSDAVNDPQRPCIDTARPLLYYRDGFDIHRVNMVTLADDVIYTHQPQPGSFFLLLDLSSDGFYIGGMEFGAYPGSENEHGTAGFISRHKARPRTSMWMIAADGSRHWRVHEEHRHLQHLLFRPNDPTTLMYCHEGPWNLVDQRLWLMRWDGTEMRPLRWQPHADMRIGHEYWVPNGHQVDYMYSCPALGEGWSLRRYDIRTETERVLTDHHFSHFICDITGDRIVGDGVHFVSLLDLRTGKLTDLVRHHQALTVENTLYHPHPAFNPAANQVLFCRRDLAGRNDIAMIDLAELGLAF